MLDEWRVASFVSVLSASQRVGDNIAAAAAAAVVIETPTRRMMEWVCHRTAFDVSRLRQRKQQYPCTNTNLSNEPPS